MSIAELRYFNVSGKDSEAIGDMALHRYMYYYCYYYYYY